MVTTTASNRRPVQPARLRGKWAATLLAVGLLLAAAALVSIPIRAARAKPVPSANPRSATGPSIDLAELTYSTTPAPGVWAELKVIVNNPLNVPAQKCVLLVPDSVLEDFRIRSTDPKLLAPPRRRPDGRYALIFAPPLNQSLNWYRVNLEVRDHSPRPIQVSYAMDGIRGVPETPQVSPRVLYTDREEDPFMVIPDALVGWLPGQGRGAFPVLVGYAVAVGAVILAGCATAFWMVRR